MKKSLLLLSYLTASTFYISAQLPEKLLEQWAKKAPIEKIHLHFDRESYIAGETIWFKAYLSSDYFPGSSSTNLYVELVTGDNKVVDKKTLPLLLGASNGQFDLPDSLGMGTYTVRAFTPSMALQSPDYLFKKGIFIHGKKRIQDPGAGAAKVKLEFFPEGGNLVAGLNNMVAFKATYEDGMPVSASGSILNSKGEQVVTFSNYHDGMGMFELNPLPGEKYMASINGQPAEKFSLPEPTEKGIVLSVIPHPQGNFFEVQQKLTDPAFVAAYMVGQMQHNVVFRQDLNKTKTSVQGVINTQHLRSGILQVTFFNQEGMPLAERLCFVNNKEFLQPGELLLDTLNFSARSRNRFRLSFKDTVQANISVSIADAAYETSREENILTSFLLTSDLKGYVHRPAYYFSSESDSVKTALDLLMMTNGWRRFRWTELTKQVATTPGPAYITLDGRATLKGTNRPFGEKNILLMISSMLNKKKGTTHILETDKDGNFFIDSLLFYERNRLIFSDIRGKKSQYIDVTLKGDSLNRTFGFSNFSPVPGLVKRAGNATWQMDYEAILKENGLMLEGVTVNAVKKTPVQQVDERYTSGLFSGDASKTIDLVNNDEAMAYSNIFDYLQFRVNGLDIGSDGFDYSVFYRQGVNMSSMGNIPMTIFLDEVETPTSVIATIPANQVALVKVFSSFVAAVGNAPGGVLAIYTKKGDDYRGTTAGITNVSIYNGYSVIKEFYAPDYKVNKTTDKVDHRITLDWRPNIFINNIDPRIPISFYNNDRTKQFKIVVEGMTSSGKLIWLEKLVGGK